MNIKIKLITNISAALAMCLNESSRSAGNGQVAVTLTKQKINIILKPADEALNFMQKCKHSATYILPRPIFDQLKTWKAAKFTLYDETSKIQEFLSDLLVTQNKFFNPILGSPRRPSKEKSNQRKRRRGIKFESPKMQSHNSSHSTIYRTTSHHSQACVPANRKCSFKPEV